MTINSDNKAAIYNCENKSYKFKVNLLKIS